MFYYNLIKNFSVVKIISLTIYLIKDIRGFRITWANPSAIKIKSDISCKSREKWHKTPLFFPVFFEMT